MEAEPPCHEGGETRVLNTATSPVVTDITGNTPKLTFKKLEQENHELKRELQALFYNGISTSTISKTTLQYEWSTDNVGGIKELEQKVSIGLLKIEAHYDAKKNVTYVEKNTTKKDVEEYDKETKEAFRGLRILKLVTEKGIVEVDY